MTPLPGKLITKVINDVRLELLRSCEIFGWQPELSPAQRLAVINEEVGEVARELNDAHNEGRPVDVKKLKAELVQAAAMCVKMAVVAQREGATKGKGEDR